MVKKPKLKYRYYDNSTTSDYERCPRLGYLRHDRDWTGQAISLPLLFGLSWHESMNIVWAGADEKCSDDELTSVAFEAFKISWKDGGLNPDADPEIVEAWGMRNPGTALEMIWEYIKQRRYWIQNVEVLEIEKPFAVPLVADDPTLFYIGRIDKKIIFERKKWGVEHKTTSYYKKDGGFRDEFLDSFTPNSQIDGYLHALHMEHGPDEIAGILVDAALVHKTVHDKFMFVEVKRPPELLDAWLYEVLTKIENIERWRNALANDPQPNSHMAAFPKRTLACGDFGGCQFKNICKSTDSPHTWEEPPFGYTEQKWEPFNILHMERLGIEQ